MRVGEIRVKPIRVNQGLGVVSNLKFSTIQNKNWWHLEAFSTPFSFPFDNLFLYKLSQLFCKFEAEGRELF